VLDDESRLDPSWPSRNRVINKIDILPAERLAALRANARPMAFRPAPHGRGPEPLLDDVAAHGPSWTRRRNQPQTTCGQHGGARLEQDIAE
jgi:hypothetical protein